MIPLSSCYCRKTVNAHMHIQEHTHTKIPADGSFYRQRRFSTRFKPLSVRIDAVNYIRSIILVLRKADRAIHLHFEVHGAPGKRA